MSNMRVKTGRHCSLKKRTMAGRESVKSESTKSKTSSNSRAKQKKAKARDPSVTAVDLAQQTAEEGRVPPQNYTSQNQSPSFPAINTIQQHEAVSETTPLLSKKRKRLRKKNEIREASQLSYHTGNLPEQFEEPGSLDIHPKKNQGQNKQYDLVRKHIPAEHDDLQMKPEEQIEGKNSSHIEHENGVRLPFIIGTPGLDIEGIRKAEPLSKNKGKRIRSPKKLELEHELQSEPTNQYHYSQSTSIPRRHLFQEQSSPTPISKQQRYTAPEEQETRSIFDIEETRYPSPAVGLPTPETSNRRLKLDMELPEASRSALYHVDGGSQLYESQTISVAQNSNKYEAPDAPGAVEAAVQRQDAKRKRRSIKSTEVDSSSVSRKKRKRVKNENEIGMPDEELGHAFNQVIGLGSAVSYGSYHSSSFSSPCAFETYEGPVEAFDEEPRLPFSSQ